MKTAALQISAGDYNTRTSVHQNDEIGELAVALDGMAVKLDAAWQKSKQLEKLRRDFVSNISHELRTPVTVIRGSLEALCDGVVTQPQMVEEYHRQMLSESTYLERLVNDLLDLARLQNPDFPMEMQEVDLQEIVEDAMHGIRRLAKNKKIEIHFACIEDHCKGFGDYGRLRQLLLILLDNAVKFSPEGGTVEVTLAGKQNAKTLSVRDEGPGISPEDLPHIFERFYVRRSEQNKSGTGLGLAIAKEIADRHGITIYAQSEPKKGASFHLEFD